MPAAWPAEYFPRCKASDCINTSSKQASQTHCAPHQCHIDFLMMPTKLPSPNSRLCLPALSTVFRLAEIFVYPWVFVYRACFQGCLFRRRAVGMWLILFDKRLQMVLEFMKRLASHMLGHLQDTDSRHVQGADRSKCSLWVTLCLLSFFSFLSPFQLAKERQRLQAMMQHLHMKPGLPAASGGSSTTTRAGSPLNNNSKNMDQISVSVKTESVSWWWWWWWWRSQAVSY